MNERKLCVEIAKCVSRMTANSLLKIVIQQRDTLSTFHFRETDVRHTGFYKRLSDCFKTVSHKTGCEQSVILEVMSADTKTMIYHVKIDHVFPDHVASLLVNR